MASPLIKLGFLVETNLIGEANSTRFKWVPAVDVLSIEESTRFQGMSEVLLTGSIRPDTGVPFILVCTESAQDLADRINKLFGFENPIAPPVGSDAPPVADVEAVPV